MKRHYYVQKMDSQERLGMPVGTIAGQDDAGIYTVTVPYRTELSLPAMPHSVTFDTIVQTAASLPPIGDNTTVDFGTVNIYQSLPPLAAQSLTSPDGMKCGLGKATVGERDDKNDNGSNVTGSALGGNANDEDTDIISEYIGHYGWWQFGWTFVLCLFQIPTTFHIFCLVFQAATRDFWCARPEHLSAVPLDVWRNLTQPDGQCSFRDAPYQQLTLDLFFEYFASFANATNDALQADTVPVASAGCASYEFDDSSFGQTIVAEFGLVCDRAHLVSIVEMCFLAGAALGSVGSGWISDQFGRRHTLMGFALTQALTGLALGFVTSLELYMALRVVLGFASMSVAVVSFVLVVELVSGRYRTIIGILNILPVALAYIMAAGIAYVTRDWRTMQFAITLPGLVLVSVWYWCPESPRWLLAKGRLDELYQLLERAATTNGLQLPDHCRKSLVVASTNGDEPEVAVTVGDVFRRKFIRTTLVMIVVWFGIILIYFGITLHLSNLGGDIYLNTVIAGSVEAIAICVSIVVVLKLGLRINLFLYMVIAGLSCIVMNFVPDGNLWLIITLAMIVKCCVGACNAIIPTFTAYQYPTTMRNLGVGVGNFAAGVALIIVPYLWLLEHVDQYLPMTIMGVFSIIGALSLAVLKDKLSSKYRQRKLAKKMASNEVIHSEDARARIESHFPRPAEDAGFSNIGFAQNESIFL
ncbi:organic cation transporter protein-like [Anopheles albimanus]|uniref:organic cation transporter protein-like n=1 Tax=Anopheles albimanus TaxID=7167 RepID=UPI0016412BCF|nr:organic cation transporter protein-like [Anopheles albimanus]XP_035780827.1 organic cation transporter protein-like [Anopheles albimanus]XP_035780828.1 organic cation transporter protein-like [Anopheles albimanus]